MTSLLAVTVLGFFLGMRHAADPDHVIAVTTIVSRHGSPARAAVVGLLWGVGHTLTILVVGAGIVLVGWVIPPRVGLSLELSVGVMLTVLGILNLRAGLRDARAGRGAGCTRMPTPTAITSTPILTSTIPKPIRTAPRTHPWHDWTGCSADYGPTRCFAR